MNALAIILVKGQAESFKICTDSDTAFFHDCPDGQMRYLGLKEATTWAMLGLAAVTLLICWLLPKAGRVGRLVPASLAAIIVGTAVEWGVNRPLLNLPTRTVGDTARLGAGVPGFHWPDLPADPAWGTIFAYALSLCMVGGVGGCVGVGG